MIPTLVDRIVISFGLSVAAKSDDRDSFDLLLKGGEILSRDLRHHLGKQEDHESCRRRRQSRHGDEGSRTDAIEGRQKAHRTATGTWPRAPTGGPQSVERISGSTTAVRQMRPWIRSRRSPTSQSRSEARSTAAQQGEPDRSQSAA